MTHPANLAAAAASKITIGALGACPLRNPHVQLLPLCYGLVEQALDPSAELQLPYSLTARPLGIRLLRCGWLYIIDSQSGELHEYEVTDGWVTALLHKGKKVDEDQRAPFEARPPLIYSRRSTLHVTFAEVQWTAAKCMQVLDSQQEREHFMQAVDLNPVHCESGGAHLLTVAQARRWLAEVGSDPAHIDHLPGDAPERERVPYLWERLRRFRQEHIGELLGQVRSPYQDDTLFLVLQDDLGVLRDLANYQDKVAGWVEDWSNAGHNERDYLLACYIESLTQLSPKDIDELSSSDDPAVQALFTDLEQLPEPQRERTRQALLEYLNRGGRLEPQVPVPAALEQLRKQAYADALRFAGHQGDAPSLTPNGQVMEETDRRYYTREHFKVAPDDFVERHLDTLIRLGHQHDDRLIALLEGSSFTGKRGINDLIDRPLMDAVLEYHREQLQRWNRLLEQITHDRTMLVCAGRFHRSAWYYDAANPTQRGQAFTAEYACLRDICRSDQASEALLGYLERHPQLTRPLFHTLPLSQQLDRATHYTSLFNAGIGLFNNLPHWLAELQQIEQPPLPALDDLPDSTRVVADAVQHSLSPALNLGLSNALNPLLEGFDLSNKTIPDLDQLFRHLPKALSLKLLDAAKTTGVTFTVASAAQLEALQGDIKHLLNTRQLLHELNRQRKQYTHNQNLQGHKWPRAVQLQDEIVRARHLLTRLEAALAAAISPIAELPDESLRLYGATPARAGVTALFPPGPQQEVHRMLQNMRLGVQSLPNASLVRSEGVGLLIFMLQAVNLLVVSKELRRQAKIREDWDPVFKALKATGAAGFAAAQGLADTALRARAAQLASGLQHHAVRYVQVQMGKMHVGLGTFTYFLGFLSSLKSLNSQQQKWQQATRTGDSLEQGGAAFAMIGAGGATTTNLYGLGHTALTTFKVYRASDAAARTAVWGAAGTRLSTVFFRFNLAGALFTVLELGGTWLYNRYNLSAHDKWLKTTPWSLDAEKRRDYALADYKQHLAQLLDTPYAQLGPNEHDTWLKNLLLKANPSDIHLVLPRLTLNDFQLPLTGQPAHRLVIGAQRISVPRYSRGTPRSRTDVVSGEVVSSLRIVESTHDHLVLCMQHPTDPESYVTPMTETLELTVCVQTLNERGTWDSQTHLIRINPAEQGHFPASDDHPANEHPGLFVVETHLLEQANHAHQA